MNEIETIECKECGEAFRRDLFARHVKKHMTYELYVKKWYHNDKYPMCKCGCGKNTLWNDKIKNYDEYYPGCLETLKCQKLGIKQSDILDIPQVCAVCGFQVKGRKSLGMHLASKHPEWNMEKYVKMTKFNGNVPLCKCGCGKEVKWAPGALRYNDYVNSHNPVGFRVEQPHFTQKQIDNRNNSIRLTYSENGNEIKKKISDAVLAAYAIPETRARMIATNYIWTDERRKNCSEAQKIAWSGEAGEIRRKKVFTPELSRKISEANMRRDCNKTSMAQSVFYNHIAWVFGQDNVEQNKWFNFSVKTWCADVWLKSERCIVEFDGVYWHGKDVTSNLSTTLTNNITNDIIKNTLAIEKGLNLVRVYEGVDLTLIKDFQSLLSVAHHVVLGGRVTLENTFHVDDVANVFHESVSQATRDILCEVHNLYWER